MNKLITIAFVSDTHGLHNYVTIPPCHILVHCGDIQADERDKDTLKDSANWLRNSGAERIIFVPGNHDYYFRYAQSYAREVFHDIDVLIDEGIEIFGINFWGSPWVTPFGGYSFEAEEPSLFDKFAKIPTDTHVLVTHSPPSAKLDYTPTHPALGSTSLAYHVARVQPTVHAFGHIHFPQGIKEEDQTTYINAAYASTKNGFYEYNPNYILYTVELAGKNEYY